MNLTDYATKHGGLVPKSDKLSKLVRRAIRSGRLVCKVHEFADGTWLMGRIALRGEGPGGIIWGKGELK